LATSAIRKTRFFRRPDPWLERRGPFGIEARLAVLLFLDPGQNLTETLVLDNGGMTDTLQLVEAE
jgi:hypothetical protein